MDAGKEIEIEARDKLTVVESDGCEVNLIYTACSKLLSPTLGSR